MFISTERSALNKRAEIAMQECHELLETLKNPAAQSKPGPLSAVRTFKQLFSVQQELEGSGLSVARSVNSLSETIQHTLIGQNHMSRVYARVFQSKLETFERGAQRFMEHFDESSSQINEAVELFEAYEAYQEAASFFQFESGFHSNNIELMKELLQDQLRSRQMIIEEFRELSRESESIKNSYSHLMAAKSVDTFFQELDLFLKKYTEFQTKLLNLLRENREYAKELSSDLEKFHTSMESLLATELQQKIQVAFQIKAVKENEELFERTAMLGHDHNQYDHPNAGSACSGLAVATLHQLLTRPTAFLDRGETFNDVLNQGAIYYENVIAMWNQRYTDEQQKEEIKAQLKEAFRESGLNGVIQRLQTYYAKFDVDTFISKYGDETDEEKLASDIMKDASIRFTRTIHDFFNFSEGANEIADHIMERIGSGNVYLVEGQEHLPNTSGYYDFLQRLKNMAEEDGRPVGAVIHIGMFIFSVSVNPDGSLFIGDTHGINYAAARGAQTAPFGIVLAKNIEDGAKLLTLHHKGSPESRNSVDNTFPYYIYRAKREEGFVPVDEIHQAFGTNKIFPSRPTTSLSLPLSSASASSRNKPTTTSSSPAQQDIFITTLNELSPSERRAQSEILKKLEKKLSEAYTLQQKGKRCFRDLSAAINSLVDSLEINIRDYYKSESKRLKTLPSMIATAKDLQKLTMPK